MMLVPAAISDINKMISPNMWQIRIESSLSFQRSPYFLHFLATLFLYTSQIPTYTPALIKRHRYCSGRNRQSALQGENQASNAFWSILPVVATFVSRGIEHAIGMCESRQTAAAQTVSWRQAEF
jgi:hypothetical protein